jgi:hypothetical protein
MPFILEQGNLFNLFFLNRAHPYFISFLYSSCGGTKLLHSVSVRLYVSTWNRKIVYDHELISCSKVVHYEGLMQAKYCCMKTSIWPKGGHFDYICSIFLFLATYNWKVFSLFNDIVEPRGLSVWCVSFG